MLCSFAESRERPRGDQEGDGAAAGGLAQTGSRNSGGGEADPGVLLQSYNGSDRTQTTSRQLFSVKKL